MKNLTKVAKLSLIVSFSAGGTSENPVLSTKAEGETFAAQKSQ
jgi:hypothetical protein